MYEFLAPWGVLIPLISALVVFYLRESAVRRHELTDNAFPAPGDASGSKPAHSNMLIVPLSWENG